MSITFDVAGQLFPNFLTMLVQWLSTGVLLFFGYKFLWNPAREFIKKRAEYSQQQIIDSQKLKEEAEGLKEEAKEIIQTANKQAKMIIDSANDEGKQIKEQLVTQAKEEASSKLAQAQKEIVQQRKEMQASVKEEIVEVALEACAKLMKDKDTDEKDRKAVEEFLAKKQ